MSSPNSIIFSNNPPPSISQNLSTLGLGYSIAIAFAFLVLLSTILLASYVCCRATTTRSNNNSYNTSTSSSSNNGIIVPRFVFVDDNSSDNLSSTVGLDQAVINTYPKFTFSKMKRVDQSNGDLEPSCCSICLCDYREAEMLRMMPDCRHFFHLTCLDAWLRLNGSCPVCRNSPLPTPISTPLAEVVPLAQFAADRLGAIVQQSVMNLEENVLTRCLGFSGGFTICFGSERPRMGKIQTTLGGSKPLS